ncbi:MAG: hypothetical protein A2150_06700 [Candidatus Muproteobacteria bacterium RBG_16_64_11]|uniref:Uncharacterized protein n=1 Tax=Candidatus Muproteobacteria bacterium RBG_16_64_11 TaxID=1817758 RepID=A0A1F6TDV5_9PROT|nr:MAG: hypothetical protein A2150_06700 [Candidatus Muproteobacteria bacterium RBG_16_64_11]
MNSASKWLFSALTLLFLFVSAGASAREAAQRSIVPEQDRICNEKCKEYVKQPTEHEGCFVQCYEAAKAAKTKSPVKTTN